MPASHLLTLRVMAYNNAWANHRLLSACARLSQAEFEAPRTGFFPSIQATLNHILTIDLFYVDALEGGTLGPAAWANPVPCPTLAELHPAQAAVDRRLIAWCSSLDERGPDQIIRVHRETRVQANALTVCCCIFSSTRSITVARPTLCSLALVFHRRSSTSFSLSPKLHCGRLNSRNSDGRRPKFGGSEFVWSMMDLGNLSGSNPESFVLHEACDNTARSRDHRRCGLRRALVLLAHPH
jgi:uncharacterized damage-inducible protein DinB